MDNLIIDQTRIIEQLTNIYRDLVMDFSFEQYEQQESMIDSLYSKLKQSEARSLPTSDLSILKELHDQLHRIILEEKNELSKMMHLSEKKKSNPYMKPQHQMDAYFFDKKQ